MKLHVRYDGTSNTFNADALGISHDSNDEAIKEVLSSIYNIPNYHFQHLVIDRQPDGIIVRPPAVFG